VTVQDSSHVTPLELDHDTLPRLAERQRQSLLDDLIDADGLISRGLFVHRELGELAEGEVPSHGAAQLTNVSGPGVLVPAEAQRLLQRLLRSSELLTEMAREQ
jgi:hypothetical protein